MNLRPKRRRIENRRYFNDDFYTGSLSSTDLPASGDEVGVLEGRRDRSDSQESGDQMETSPNRPSFPGMLRQDSTAGICGGVSRDTETEAEIDRPSMPLASSGADSNPNGGNPDADPPAVEKVFSIPAADIRPSLSTAVDYILDCLLVSPSRCRKAKLKSFLRYFSGHFLSFFEIGVPAVITMKSLISQFRRACVKFTGMFPSFLSMFPAAQNGSKRSIFAHLFLHPDFTDPDFQELISPFNRNSRLDISTTDMRSIYRRIHGRQVSVREDDFTGFLESVKIVEMVSRYAKKISNARSRGDAAPNVVCFRCTKLLFEGDAVTAPTECQHGSDPSRPCTCPLAIKYASEIENERLSGVRERISYSDMVARIKHVSGRNGEARAKSCFHCATQVKKGNAVPHANTLHVLKIPPVFTALNSRELACLSLCKHMAHISRASNVSSAAQTGFSYINPNSLQSIFDNLPENESINHSKIDRALTHLKQHNYLYKRYMPLYDISLPAVSHSAPENTSSNDRRSSDLSALNPFTSLNSVGATVPEHTSEGVRRASGSAIYCAAFSSAATGDRQDEIFSELIPISALSGRQVNSGRSMSQPAPSDSPNFPTRVGYADPRIFCYVFPHLFSDGRAPYSERNRDGFGYSNFVKEALLSYFPQFREDRTFSFFAFDIKWRLCYSRASVFTAKGTSSSLVDVASGGIKRAALNELPRTITGTPNYWRSKRSDLYALCAQAGAPTFFLTLTCNSGDICFKTMIANSQSQNPLFHPTEIVRCFFNRWKMAKRLILSKTFSIFREHFGSVTHHATRTEFQERGGVHLHIVIWTERPFSSTSSNPVSAINVNNPQFSGLISSLRHQLHKDLLLQLRRNMVQQQHNCLNNRKCGGRDGHCRYGFPFPVPQSDVKFTETYVTYPRTSMDADIIPYCPIITLLMNCHMNLQVVNTQNANAASVINYLLKYTSKRESDTRGSIRFRSGIETLNTRRVTAPEVACNLLEYPFFKMSSKVHFVFVGNPNDRQRKPVSDLNLLRSPGDAKFHLGDLDRYMLRSALHETMTYPQFVSAFDPVTDSSTPARTRHVFVGRSIYHSPNNPVRYVRRSKPKLLRCAFLIPSDGYRFYAAAWMLNVPFRGRVVAYRGGLFFLPSFHDPNEIDQSNERLQEDLERVLFSDCSSLENRLSKTYRSVYGEIDAEQLQIMISSALRRQRQDRDHNNEQQHEPSQLSGGINDEGYQLLLNRLMFGLENPTEELMQRIAGAERSANEYTAGMNDEQRRTFNSITDSVLDYYQDPTRARETCPLSLITGSGGTGKSFLINRLISFFRERAVWIGVAAPSAIAAKHIGGCTIHSLFRLDGELRPRNLLDSAALRFLEIMKVLLIDEISMVSRPLFGQINETLRRVHGNDAPFGGVAVILVGDFFQLPPVVRNPLVTGAYFNSILTEPLFQRFNRLQLNTVVRQTDPDFTAALHRVRLGCELELALEFFRDRKIRNGVSGILQRDDFPPHFLRDIGSPETSAVILCTTNDLVNQYNEFVLSMQFPDTRRTLRSLDFYRNRRANRTTTRTLNRDIQCYCPGHLVLSIGCKVMVTRNIDFDRGIVNGVTGIVTGFTNTQGPDSVGEVLVNIEGIVRRISRQKYYPQVARSMFRLQFPLRLAYSMSIHKSQGCTFDKVLVHITKENRYQLQHGQMYVALSRVRTKRGLYLVNFRPEHIVTDPNIQQLLLSNNNPNNNDENKTET